MWIANLSYWGFNQYIIQRALAAKSLAEAQKGVIFAAFLKLLMPVIIVVPGIAAVVLAPDLAKPDEAYPTMMRLLPPGLLGLVFAALVAAIIASTASKINSIATIFTLDLYAKFRGNRRGPRTAGEAATRGKAPRAGRPDRAIVAIIIAIIVARPLVGKSEQAFQYIQEFTGFFTPGITVIFLLGLFWKRATEAGAIAAAVASVLLSADEIHAAVGCIVARHERLSDALHEPHGRRVPGVAGARDRRLAGTKPRPASTRSRPPTYATRRAPGSMSARSASS